MEKGDMEPAEFSALVRRRFIREEAIPALVTCKDQDRTAIRAEVAGRMFGHVISQAAIEGVCTPEEL